MTVQLRIARNLVPYGAWVHAGHIIETKGEVTDYDVIKDTVLQADEDFKIVSIAYDTWNAAQLAKKLEDEDIVMVPFIQGPKSYHPAMKHFEESYISGNFRHGGDPVLTWCASNLTARTDPNMNMAPDKKKSNDKIDDMTALLMAIGTAIGNAEEEEDLDDFINDPIILK
jgi:phage terminase large subunit-like protein